MSKVNNNLWYKEWFNHLYPKIYPQRNLNEAQLQVEAVTKLLNITGDCLDIACGTGRHLKFLANHFNNAFGIDLSSDLIQIGKEQGNFANANVRVSDMREPPFAERSFDLVTNFFTGFGYFETDKEHQALLKTWSRLLKPNGILLLDYLNRDQIIKNIIPETTREIEAYKVIESRKISDDGLRVEKKIEITSKEFNKTFHESVRMYNAEQLEQMLIETELSIIGRYGDFSWNCFNKESDRLIMIAKNVR